MNKLVLLSTLLLAFFLTSAGCPKDKTNGVLTGSWKCISIAKVGSLEAVQPTAKIDTAKKTFGGNGGCNSYFSNFETMDNGKISITGLGSTKMACEGERSTVESAYFDALQTAASFEIKGDKLVLSGSGGPLAVFVKN